MGVVIARGTTLRYHSCHITNIYAGQYTFNPAFQGIPNSAFAWQTVGNAISFATGLIAALLYGNIGVKVFYAAVLRDIFHFPPLGDKKGRLVWIALGKIIIGLLCIIQSADSHQCLSTGP